MSKKAAAVAGGSAARAVPDLDSILDQALDDFEELELKENAKKAMGEQERKAQHEENRVKYEIDELERAERLQKTMADLNNPEYGASVQQTLKALSGNAEGIKTVDDLFDRTAKQFSTELKSGFPTNDADDPENVANADREITSTLKMIADAQKGMEGFEPGKMEEVGETMMEEMMAQFEELGEREDYNEVIDGVMRQLLAKDLMYEPTKQICAKFPEWLATHRSHLTEHEYNNYGKMYQSFQKLLATYDSEPDNFPRLMELMFDMQQYGQPPAEIIKDLAPGLKFDENGMPIMPNMGPGMMHEMPGGEGLPDIGNLAQNMATGQCSIM